MPATIITTQYIRDQIRLVVDPLLLQLREQIYGSGIAYNTTIGNTTIPGDVVRQGQLDSLVGDLGYIKTIRVLENGTSKGFVKELNFVGATVGVTGDQATVSITATSTVKHNNVNVGTAFTAFDFKDSSTPELDWIITDNSPTVTVELDLSPHINKVATNSILGHVMIGSGLHVTSSGLLTVSGATIQSSIDILLNGGFHGTALGLDFQNNAYGVWTLVDTGDNTEVEFDISLHANFEATNAALGHVIVGDGLTVTDGVVSLNLEITEIDGVPDISGVNRIRFPNGSVTNDGGGQVTITISGGSEGGTASGIMTHVGPFGDEPVAGSGHLYFTTPSGYMIERYDGVNWSPWGPIFPLSQPPLTGWTMVNGGTGSYQTVNGCVTIICPGNNTSFTPRLIRTAPSGVYTVTALFSLSNHVPGNVNEGFGFVLQQSSDNKSVSFHVNPKDASINVARWNGDYSFDSVQVFGVHDRFFPAFWWVRVQDDGTNRIWYFSTDGIWWIQAYSSVNTEWCTPDRIGFFGYNGSSTASYINAASLLSWKVE